MDAHTALYGYDALWAELKVAAHIDALHTRGKTSRVLARSRTDVVVSMIAHYDAAFALYEGNDPYRAAMWLRRGWLHRHGRTDHVYDGADPLEWRRIHDGARAMPDMAALRAARGA